MIDMENNDFNISKTTIGVVGGFGSYATLHFFKRILDNFDVEKEWERPRIIIDNYCTLPSRVRCILYGEQEQEIIEGLNSSIQNLIKYDCDYIIIICNTAHYFLNQIYNKTTESKERIINLIYELTKDLVKDHVAEISLIASEGTILSGIYHDSLEKNKITVYTPQEDEFYKMRELIEVVKQNKPIDESVKDKFIDLLLEQKSDNIILGCTEFPVIYEEVKDDKRISDLIIYDPLDSALSRIKENTD